MLPNFFTPLTIVPSVTPVATKTISPLARSLIKYFLSRSLIPKFSARFFSSSFLKRGNEERALPSRNFYADYADPDTSPQGPWVNE